MFMAIGFNNRAGSASLLVARKKQRLFLIGGATLVVCSLLIAILLIIQSNNVQATQKETVEPVVVDTNVVIIAANTKIPKGTKIKASHLSEVHWPKDQLPQGVIKVPEKAINMYAANTIVESQPITQDSLSQIPVNTNISELLTPGTRAVTINVNATSGVEGWATPGAHVDVLLTYLDSSDSQNKTIVAVENAVVLSYDGISQDSDTKELTRDSKNKQNNTTVTLGVPIADSLKLQTAISLGRITLAMRSQNDITTPNITEFSQNQWSKPAAVVKQQQAPIKGYARFSTKEGQQKQFVLSSDNQWQKDHQDDNSY